MRLLFPLALLGSVLGAQTPDYFPLQSGNQYLYQPTGVGASERVIQVGQPAPAPSGFTYYPLAGFSSRELRVRLTPDNRLVRLDPGTGSETLLLDFAAPELASFPTAIDPCSTSATILTRSGTYSGPIGSFDTALIVQYSGICADAGIVRDLFLPYIGLVQRTETSFTGPRTYDLAYALVGGVTQVAGPHVSFEISLDKISYQAGEKATARMALRNTRPEPLELQFGSGQEFDVLVIDAAGKEVYRWSAGRMFAQVLHSLTVSGEKNWVAQVSLPATLAPGKYSAQAYLTAVGAPPRRYSASAGFEIAR
jgi:hypothetical protein